MEVSYCSASFLAALIGTLRSNIRSILFPHNRTFGEQVYVWVCNSTIQWVTSRKLQNIISLMPISDVGPNPNNS